jgi:hypothetical protein
MAEYVLQSTVVASGTLEITLITDLAALTIPTYASLSPVGEFVQRVDVLPGVQELEQAEFEYFEDYSTYDEGFWFKVLMYGGAQIRVTIDDTGTGQGMLFWGAISEQMTNIEEVAMYGGKFVRKGKFTAVSLMSLLREVATGDIEVDLRSHPTQITVAFRNGVAAEAHGSYIKLRAVFEQAVAAAFGQPLDSSAVVAIGNEIEFSPDDTNFFGFDDLYVEGWVAGTAWNGMMDSTRWVQRFPHAFDLLAGIARCFGYVVKHDAYIGSGDVYYHRILLISRNQTTSAQLTFPNPTKSDVVVSSQSEVRYFQFDSGNGLPTYYYDREGSVFDSQTKPFGFDPNYTLLAEIDNHPTGADPICVYVYDSGADNMQSCSAARVWNCLTSAWEEYTQFRVAIYKFYITRFGGNKRVYSREYATMKDVAGTQGNLTLCARHAITDGVAARNFYATEIRKDPLKNSSFIRWQEV